MRITVATGIYPPEIGGPATYAAELAARLSELGHTITVVTYADAPMRKAERFPVVAVVRGNRLFNRVRFFLKIWPHARAADCLYLLDWFAAGVPAAFAARIAGTPYLVRVGGDYLWEQLYLESGNRPLPLSEFYKNGLHRRFSYVPFRLLISSVLSHAAHVIFNSDAQRRLYERHWGLPAARTSVIENPKPRIEGIARSGPTDEFVYWGRYIVMKNLDTLLRAFARARLPEKYSLTLIGDGPQKSRLKSLAWNLGLHQRVRFERGRPFRDVLERVKNSRAFILPSWTDIAPNQVYEALALGLPALVTRENYLHVRDRLPETFGPDSVDELASKLEMLADDGRYRTFAASCRSIRVRNDWDSTAAAHVRLFERTLGTGAEFRALQIGADRSKRGILFPGSPAFERQAAYADAFGTLDIIGFSLKSDGAFPAEHGALRIHPTDSRTKLGYFFDALRIAKSLARPGVVSAQDPFEAGLVAWLVARRFHAPLHVQVHTDFLSPSYARHPFANRLRVFLARFVLRRAARIRVVSDRIRDGLMMLDLGVPITVLPIFVDLQRLKDARADTALSARFARFSARLLVVARLESEKNVALAVGALAASAPPHACLIVVGDGSERTGLEALAARLKISDRCFFEGERDATPYYALADLVLVPSRYEGYGLAIVEALARGVPVLSTDVGVAREAGAIVASPENFAGALKEWFDKGPRAGALKGYPYATFDEYVRAYRDDIVACVRGSKA